MHQTAGVGLASSVRAPAADSAGSSRRGGHVSTPATVSTFGADRRGDRASRCDPAAGAARAVQSDAGADPAVELPEDSDEDDGGQVDIDELFGSESRPDVSGTSGDGGEEEEGGRGEEEGEEGELPEDPDPGGMDSGQDGAAVDGHHVGNVSGTARAMDHAARDDHACAMGSNGG